MKTLEHLEYLKALATTVYKSGSYPEYHKRFKKVRDCMDAQKHVLKSNDEGTINSIMATFVRAEASGMEPMIGLYSIVHYNDVPCLYGDAAWALVQKHPAYAGFTESYNAQTEAYVFTLSRKASNGLLNTISRMFSMEDARKAGLDKLRHYKDYKIRMLMIRARSWAMRDLFSDALNGLSIAEEQKDVEILASFEEPKKTGPRKINHVDAVDDFTKAEMAQIDQESKPDFNSLKRPDTGVFRGAKKPDAVESRTHEADESGVINNEGDLDHLKFIITESNLEEIASGVEVKPDEGEGLDMQIYNAIAAKELSSKEKRNERRREKRAAQKAPTVETKPLPIPPLSAIDGV